MANLLNLDTLTERNTVTVDGVPYDLINPGQLSILDQHRVLKWGARVQELHATVENLSDAAITEMGELLDRFCRLVLPAPPEVHDRVSDNQRLKLMSVFTELLRGETPAPAGASAAPVADETSTGESK